MRAIRALKSEAEGASVERSQWGITDHVCKACFGRILERRDEKDEIFYIDASGVRVCWLVDKETSND